MGVFVAGELEENLSSKGKNQQQTLPTYSCMAFKFKFKFKCEFKYLIIHFPQGFSGIIYNTGWGTLPDCLRCSLQVMKE